MVFSTKPITFAGLKKIITYLFPIVALSLGASLLFAKINKHDFYHFYFRIIAEITDRNSHSLVRTYHCNTVCEATQKWAQVFDIEIFTDRSFNHDVVNLSNPTLSAAHQSLIRTAQQKNLLPFSIAPPFVA